MTGYLGKTHQALQKRAEAFARRVERVDFICEDANVADAYIRSWARTQHALLAAGKSSVARYLNEIERRGFTSEGILGTVSRELVRLMGAEGLFRHLVPKPYGGVSSRVDPVSLCLIRRVLAERSVLADVLFAVQGLGSYPVTIGGSERLRRRILRGIARGERIPALAMTEPDAGSDILGIETRAVRNSKGWILDGTKTLVSNAGIADLYTVVARTGADGSREPASLSVFVVDSDSEGVILNRKIELQWPHVIGEVRFRNVLVPPDRIVGRPGQGLRIINRTLELFRASVAAAAVGMARRALEESLDYVGRRRQFGRLLSSFQGIRFKLADMATSLRAAELLVFDAARQRARGRGGAEASMAKLFATETAQKVVDDAVQIHGGLGVIKGTPVERLYRAIRALRIYEGTSEIQRIIIARHLLGERD